MLINMLTAKLGSFSVGPGVYFFYNNFPGLVEGLEFQAHKFLSATFLQIFRTGEALFNTEAKLN